FSHEELHAGFLAQQGAMLETFSDSIDLWEAMNEPAATNERGFVRQEINSLLDASAKQLRGAGKPTLVNSGHESNFGNKFALYRTDNQPVENAVLTYHEALDQAVMEESLEAVDIIGIQFY